MAVVAGGDVARGRRHGLWLALVRAGFRRHAAYRGAAIAGVFTNCVFGFMRLAVITSLFAFNDEVGGFDNEDTTTYVWLTQSMIMIVHLWGWTEISDRVRSGEIATDLTRPVDVQAAYLAADIGRAGWHLLARAIPPVVVGATFSTVLFPDHVGVWLAVGVSALLGATLSFGWRFLQNLSSFWLLDIRGVTAASAFVTLALSGFIVPIGFLPGWTATVARLLPFASMIQTPIDVWLGKPWGGPWVALGLQVFWALAALGLGRLVMARATIRLVVQGG